MKKPFFFLWLLVNTAWANKIYEVPQIYSPKDSIGLGEQVKVTLVYTHDPKLEILFPDLSFNYFPFEFVSKKHYPTRTDSLRSTDSVTYTLRTFELGPELELNLPIFIISNKDTLPIYSDDLLFFITQKITQPTQADTLKVNTQYISLKQEINVYYWGLGIGLLILIMLVIFVFFRKSILTKYQIFKMKRENKKFNLEYNALKLTFFATQKNSTLESMLTLWKSYLEKLEKIPYTTLTTKEISSMLNHKSLTSALQNFDKCIYGGSSNFDMKNSIELLQEVAQFRFEEKIKTL